MYPIINYSVKFTRRIEILQGLKTLQKLRLKSIVTQEYVMLLIKLKENVFILITNRYVNVIRSYF